MITLPPEDHLLKHEALIQLFPRLPEALEDMVVHGVITDLRTALWSAVGKGGSSFVTRVRQSDAESGWAIKTPKFLDQPVQTLQSFARERDYMGRVTCSPRQNTLVKQDHGYILMEYIEGHTFDDLREKFSCLPLAARAAIAQKTADNMLEVESAGLLHCDVKPGNLMLRDNNDTVILDFNSAVETAHAADVDKKIRGTQGYMAPERFRGVLSRAGEVYGLGKTFFTTLFSGTADMIEETTSLKQGTVNAAVDSVVTDIRWNDLLKEMLTPAPRKRISLSEVAQELSSMSAVYSTVGNQS